MEEQQCLPQKLLPFASSWRVLDVGRRKSCRIQAAILQKHAGSNKSMILIEVDSILFYTSHEQFTHRRQTIGWVDSGLISSS